MTGYDKYFVDILCLVYMLLEKANDSWNHILFSQDKKKN